ncbi:MULTISPECIES: hypothetical protein [unclassified Rhizobium]|nr:MULTISPECIES: hypothetical protein [unclassified Rhizobium]MBB3384982.1 hypothetical protein [Rhizobium sp. BK098]MBB3616441.1 hypothetical protein [Rhizobium sp. BK609]MBB3682100.1 hypothetical protein [Rhizobium sp. BK612]
MFNRSVFAAVVFALIGFGIASCSTSGERNSGGGMTLNAPPTGGGY